jgi:hypothetical protein
MTVIKHKFVGEQYYKWRTFTTDVLLLILAHIWLATCVNWINHVDWMRIYLISVASQQQALAELFLGLWVWDIKCLLQTFWNKVGGELTQKALLFCWYCASALASST